MAEALKTKGREEIAAVRKRVIRQYGNEDISRGDYTNLIKMIDELDAYIVAMPERLNRTFIKRKAP